MQSLNENSEANKLPEENTKLFHHLVAKLLYLCRSMRQNIWTAITCICNRVQAPNDDNYKKRTRVPTWHSLTDIDLWTKWTSKLVGWQFLHGPPRHENSQQYIYEIGQGRHVHSIMQAKIEPKSSTQGVLVAIHNLIVQVLWTRHSLAAQQDNKSTILLSENGWMWSSRRTWHLNVEYFFVTDKIKKGKAR